MKPLAQALSDARAAAPSLRRRAIFLSASFPSSQRRDEFPDPADDAEIANAVVSVAKAILGADGVLVFGGHPTITPLMLWIARGMAAPPTSPGEPTGTRVIAYQSRVFANNTSPEMEAFQSLEGGLGRVEWVPAHDNEQARFNKGVLDPSSVVDSLRDMRRAMLDTTRPVAAVYVGGMKGIFDEFNMATGRDPGPVSPRGPAIHVVPRHYAFGAPGGAAAAQVPNAPSDAPASLQGDLRRSRHYPDLAARIVEDVARHLP